MTILENLYNGNINPSDTEKLKNNPEYTKSLELVCRARKKLTDTLNDEQKVLLENYIINTDELSIITEETIFKEAFSLAMKIMMEIQ